MLILPAIDLMGGACVRLMQGRFDQSTNYGADPLAQLEMFGRAGAEWAHVVDLDGAKAKSPSQHDLIGRLARARAVKIQSGGGVRSADHVRALLDAGVGRVVVGSSAALAADEVGGWIEEFGVERIVCAFDVKRSAGGYEVMVEGWIKNSEISLAAALGRFAAGALKHVLVTDVSRDGALSGPNVELLAEIIRLRPDFEVQASGGVASLDHVKALRATGAAAAIIGRALYEKKFTLEEALAG